MPTYEYKCDACGHAFERFQQITAPAVKTCPKCGKKKVRRLISAGGGLIFKGSGFYITDYRDAGYKDKAKADTNSETKPAAETTAPAAAEAKSSDGKIETKSAETKEATPTKAESKSAAKPAGKSEKKSKK